MKTEKTRNKFYELRWLVVFFWCVGLLCGKSFTVHAEAPKGVMNLRQTEDQANGFKIEWDAAEDAYGYQVQYSKDGTEWVHVGFYSPSELGCYINFAAKTGHKYKVRVRSGNSTWYITGGQQGEASPWTTLETVTTPRMIDSLFDRAATATTVTIGWSCFDDDVSYEVQYKKGSSWVTAGSTTSNTYKIKGLKEDTCYKVRVNAVIKSAAGYKSRVCGTGYNSCTISTKAPKCELKKWDTSSNDIVLQWSKGPKYATGYQIEIYDLSGKKIEKSRGLYVGNWITVNRSSLKKQGFMFRVRGCLYLSADKYAYSPWSAKKVVIAQPKLTLKKSGSKNIQLNWSKIKGAASYTVYRSTKATGGFKKIKTVKSTKYTDKGLNSKKTYYYYVVANGVKVNGRTYKTTSAVNREIAHLSKNKTVYTY